MISPKYQNSEYSTKLIQEVGGLKNPGFGNSEIDLTV
jgi:hypothetical protein